ncbi:MAG TPA: DUF998 domain-containing protein [Allosphingosinicella sp.]|nr:DUF998 domain-containing protein [Allosphingosinicella sp.]
MVTRILLCLGVLSSLLWVGIDILGAVSWEDYSYTSQTVSEMSAVDAPTRQLLSPFYIAYSLLLIAFGGGVSSSAGGRNGRLVAGALLATVGLVGLVQPFFPMHMRGVEPSFTDIGHIVLGGVNVLLLIVAIGFGAREFGRKFRLFSVTTILIMLVFGVWTAFLAPAIPEGQPTPYLGLIERVIFAAFLLWIASFAFLLLRAHPRERSTGHSVGTSA